MARRNPLPPGAYPQLRRILRAFHQDISIDFPGWDPTLGSYVRGRRKADLLAALAEIDRLLPIENEHHLTGALWMLGAENIPLSDPHEALRGVRAYLQEAIEAMSRRWQVCMTCGRPLGRVTDPLSVDCGGDCWGCIGAIEFELNEQTSRATVLGEIQAGLRLPDGTPKPRLADS